MLNGKRIFGLDFLRAVAIILVIFANCIYIFPTIHPVLSQLASLIGFFGLEVFLVLSGFLLGTNLYPVYMRDDFGFKTAFRFTKARMVRILPLYFVVLLVNFLIAYIMDYHFNGGWGYFLLVQNFASPIPDFFPESWGLPIIVFAAVLFPIALAAMAELSKQIKKRKLFAIATIIFILLPLIAKCIYNANAPDTDIQQWDVSLKTVLIYRIDSVFIGTLFGWMYWNLAPLWIKLRWFLAGLGCIVVLFLAVGIGHFQLVIEKYHAFWNIFYLPMATFSIALFLPLLSTWQTYRHLQKPIIFISSSSYAVYLVHFSIVLQLMEHFALEKTWAQKQLWLVVLSYPVIAFLAGKALQLANRATFRNTNL